MNANEKYAREQLLKTNALLSTVILYLSTTRNAVLSGEDVQIFPLDGIDDLRIQRQINLGAIDQLAGGKGHD